MTLQLHNTLTGKKEPFEPAEPGHVRCYACGPTVYDYFHIGNARAFVVFDTLRRVLERQGWRVTFVQNITDVDDKIIARACRENRPAPEVAEEFTRAFKEDLAALGCRPADVAPRATEHMAEIIALVERLVAAGHAYALENGDVYFAVRSFPAYGKLSGKKIEELEEGARVEVDARKRDPLDFALWKSAKPGEPSWPSPWGAGRPGWHIECSAMSMKYLGESFDIHGGGEDLVFPHHENENAQSEALTGQPLARVWLHNGFLKIEGEKMSKSLGNFRVVRDILQVVPNQVLRLFLLSAHYRSPLDFSQENVETILNGYAEFCSVWDELAAVLRVAPVAGEDAAVAVFAEAVRQAEARFGAFLADDLNTAGAIGQMYSLANDIKKFNAGKPKITPARQAALREARARLEAMAGIFGILPTPPALPAEDQALTAERERAREAKDFARADELKRVLTGKGYLIKDTPFGSVVSLHPRHWPRPAAGKAVS